ncbi:MAG: zinc ribbon domain-containing protein [Ignavibacteriae bacterium]|nr:zinc ribbon domain-containing protein [Ignavibacteriota bacterium]
MPTYQYVCKQCGHELEELQSINDPPLTRCPNCNTDGLVRAIGAGGGLIFKGSGFYLTDYKKDGGKGEKTKTKKEEKKPEAKEAKPSDTKASGSSSEKKTS